MLDKNKQKKTACYAILRLLCTSSFFPCWSAPSKNGSVHRSLASFHNRSRDSSKPLKIYVRSIAFELSGDNYCSSRLAEWAFPLRKKKEKEKESYEIEIVIIIKESKEKKEMKNEGSGERSTSNERHTTSMR